MLVDISGFTDLAERLASFGKEGVEVLSNIINDIFTPCIESIYKRGGEVTAFIGDAFIAVFRNDPLNAAFSSVEIINEFNKQMKKKTKFGLFELSAKIGISLGDVEWGITGTDQRKTYYFKGHAIDSCSESESKAGPMEIITDLEYYNTVNEFAEFESKDDTGIFFRVSGLKCREKTLGDPEIIEIDNSVLKVFVPPFIIDNKPLDELRDIVSIFVSFRNVDRTYQSLNRFSKSLIKLVDDWGGYFRRINFDDKGGTILINFGVPVSYENNIYRALSCINQIRADYNENIRAGITFGRVFAGTIGSKTIYSYDVLGDAVNLAARMAMSAEWGNVWVSENTYAMSHKNFNHSFHGEFQFKGKQKSIKVYLLKGEKAGPKTRFKGKIHGRESEISSLYDYLRPVMDRRSAGIINIYGDAGIGKSRLVHDTLLLFGGNIQVYHMQCDSILKKSWNPIIFLLRNFFMQNRINELSFQRIFNKTLKDIKKAGHNGADEIINELTRTQCFLKALLGLETSGTLYDSLNAKGKYENTIYAVKELFKGLALIKPLIIQIEDIHCIDYDTLNFLRYFLRNIAHLPIAIICTGRYNDDGTKPDLQLENETYNYEIELGGLSEVALKDLICDLLGDIPDDELFDFIAKRTSNNPYFAEQFCLYLKENNFIEKKSNAFHLIRKTDDVPSRINQILIARIDRLSREIREITKIASVFGREFNKDILFDTLESLNTLINSLDFHNKGKFDAHAISRLLKDDRSMFLKQGKKENIWNNTGEAEYHFTNSILSESAYNMQLRERLRILHQTIAYTIERILPNDKAKKSYLVDLAYHFEKAEIRDKTIEYLEKAGDFLQGTYKNKSAIEAYNKLLEYNRDKKKEIIIKLKSGNIYDLTGEWQLSENIYSECLNMSRKIKNNGLIARSCELYGMRKQARGEFNEGLALLKESEGLYRQMDDKKGIGSANSAMAGTYYMLGEYDRALKCLEKSKRLFEDINYQQGISISLGQMAGVYYSMGNYEKALEYCQIDRDISKKAGNKIRYATTTGNMGNIYKELGDYAKALECFETYRRISTEIGNKSGIGASTGNLGNIYLATGQYDKALECFKIHKRISEETGNKKEIGIATGNMGVIYYLTKNYKKALECHEKYRRLSEEIGFKWGIHMAIGNMGNVYSAIEEHEKALECYMIKRDIAKEIGDRQGIGTAIGNMGNVYRDLFDFPRALECYEDYKRTSMDIGHRDGIREATELMAMIQFDTGNYTKAVESYMEVLQLTEDITHKAVIYTELANIYYYSENFQKAKDTIQKACKMAEELNKKDLMHKVQVKKHIIYAGDHGKAESSKLHGLLDKGLNDEQKAEIFYELYLIENKEKHKNISLNLYSNLFSRHKKFKDRERIKQLRSI